MRKNYFELLENTNIDIIEEFNKLEKLIHQIAWKSGWENHRSLYDEIVEQFLEYKHRGNFLDFRELSRYLESECNSLDEYDRYYCYAEMYMDILADLEVKNPDMERQIKYVNDQIKMAVNSTQHEIKEVNGRRIILESNAAATEASQIITEYGCDVDALNILEYNHYANKGNITRKREILIKIAALLEPWRESLNTNVDFKDVLKCGNNNKIVAVEKLFRMYNEMNIRHNNDKQKLDSLSEQEIEAWYDKIYTMSLFVILGKDVSQILSDFKAFDVES